jgi:rubrerythrin
MPNPKKRHGGFTMIPQIVFTNEELRHIALNDKMDSQNWLEFNKKTSVTKVQQQQATTDLLMRNVVEKYQRFIEKLNKEFPNMDGDDLSLADAFALGKKRGYEKIVDNLQSFTFLEAMA